MPSTLIEIANAIKNLNDSKWHCHIQYFVSKIGISPEVADSFIRQIEKGGRGVRRNGMWQANPSPYENPIDLISPNDNILGLRYSIIGAKSVRETTFAEPSPLVVGYKPSFPPSPADKPSFLPPAPLSMDQWLKTKRKRW